MPKKQVAPSTAGEAEGSSAASVEAKAPKSKAPKSKAPKAKANRSEAKEEAEFQKTVDAMKAELSKQPKVGVYIPLEQGEPKGTQLPVEINGYRMNVPKGVPNVQVPQSVAEIIWQSLGVYEEASSGLRSQNEPGRPLRLDLQKESDREALNA